MVYIIEDDKPKKELTESNIEDALKATGFGKFHIWITLTGGLLLYAMNSECWSVSYIVSSAECDMNLSLEQKTILVTIGSVGILSTQFFWGYLSDKFGRRNIMLYALSGGFLCTVISVLAPMFWLVALFRFLNGTLVAAVAGISFAYAGEFFAAKYRSVSIMVMSVFIGVALVLIPLMAWVIIPQEFSGLLFGFNVSVSAWRVFLVVAGLPAMIAWITLYFSPESPKFLANAQRNEDALNVLRKMHKINGNKERFMIESLKEDEIENEEVKIGDLFSKKYIWKTLLVCTIQGGVFATSGGLFLWYPDILQRIYQSGEETTVCGALNIPDKILNGSNDFYFDFDVDKKQECVVEVDNAVYSQNILIGMGYTVGYLAISALVNTIGVKAILICFLGMSGLATFALHFVIQPLIIDILFMALLVLSGVCVVVVNAAVVEIYPTNLRGMAVCLTMLSGRLATIIASSLVGYLLEWNCEVTFMLFSASLIGSSLLAFLLPASK